MNNQEFFNLINDSLIKLADNIKGNIFSDYVYPILTICISLIAILVSYVLLSKQLKEELDIKIEFEKRNLWITIIDDIISLHKDLEEEMKIFHEKSISGNITKFEEIILKEENVHKANCDMEKILLDLKNNREKSYPYYNKRALELIDKIENRFEIIAEDNESFNNEENNNLYINELANMVNGVEEGIMCELEVIDDVLLSVIQATVHDKVDVPRVFREAFDEKYDGEKSQAVSEYERTIKQIEENILKLNRYKINLIKNIERK
ncbi:hypothetical protein SAMN02745245_01932 [Anaerosphaera aminiphila DSM 21120]|uniref:Uncharacterized protein n=1 Tax=Anaerosphaera aminiphila DSM 21120 TaxID=1120995 RepID=A0A1M5UZP9_9FIRM|nr:hypothetical protein [Anaerosphaera aminiphila]SHH68472.1 hypothetical protein SAMN02745245_01932 [Anaerosphaera aminiphila DSM 21120]